jgi:cellobiose-specific phosphotransferase system component IIC
MIALLSIGIFFIGWNESVCLSCAGIELLDQQEIGTAVGAAGSIRSAVSSVANAVYLSVLSNRMAITIPSEVPPAVIAAGLPEESVATFIGGFATGNFANITGLTPEIQAVGTRAYQIASAQAYSTVFYSTLAFTGIGIILAFFNPNVDDKMTGDIAVTLHHTDADKMGNAEKVENA